MNIQVSVQEADYFPLGCSLRRGQTGLLIMMTMIYLWGGECLCQCVIILVEARSQPWSSLQVLFILYLKRGFFTGLSLVLAG